MFQRIDAIAKLARANGLVTPTTVTATNEGITEWIGGNEPTSDEIDATLAEMEVEWTAQEYARTRQPLYPDIGDQLDDLYHAGVFSAEMLAKLKKVKDDNPKPE
tara:strand:+ start:819 stop:1130 length:312 start_codon:yes stop_codon:yes gene_type:complete